MSSMTVPLVMTLVGALLGLVVGSFLNVVVWRVPRGESVVTPGSHCPACGAPVRPRDNIPVLSWLVLRGRCRDCDAPISARYPLVEAVTAVAFLAVAARFGPSWELPAYLYLAAIAVALALIDIEHHRLPNPIVVPSYAVLAALLLLPTITGGRWGDLARAGAGAAILFAFYLVLVLVYPAGMGWGDVKLAGVLGMALGYLGWAELAVGAFGGFLLGGVFSIALVIARRAGRKTAIPFGPFMLAGALVGVLWGRTLAEAYLGVVLG